MLLVALFSPLQVMPNLGRLVARESDLEGFYRTSHTRLITNSEEIAFYDGAAKEKRIINSALQAICRHIAYSRYIKALVGIFDGLLVKYYATIAGYLVLLTPFIFRPVDGTIATTSELTRDYIRNSQYLGQLSTAVGQLVMVGNKLTSIAGYTSRVSELLEQVRRLNQAGSLPFEIRVEGVAAGAAAHSENEHGSSVVETVQRDHSFIEQWRARCDAQDAALELRHSANGDVGAIVPASSHRVPGGGEIRTGPNIEFDHVDIVSPEGRLLVKDLTFTVERGTNVMVTGPNGVGP